MRFLQCMNMCVLLRPREVCFPTMCCCLIVDLDTKLWRNLKLYSEHGSLYNNASKFFKLEILHKKVTLYSCKYNILKTFVTPYDV